MFIKDKTTDALAIPKDAKVTWVVKYQGGRKPFQTEREARRFIAENRASTENAWAELIQQIEIVKVKRK